MAPLLDLDNPEAWQDLPAAYAPARAAGPVYVGGNGSVIVLRHAQASAVLKDPAFGVTDLLALYGITQGSVIRPAAGSGNVYLAGPSGFFAAGLLWHNTVVVPTVRAAGLTPKDPWSGESAIAKVTEAMEYGPERRAALQEANRQQGRYDLALIDESEAILASLDGPDVDSGTAVEVGYGFAKGLLIVGLRTDTRRSSDNEGSIVNLMIETCIVDSGGMLTDSLHEAVAFLVERLGVAAPGGRSPGGGKFGRGETER